MNPVTAVQASARQAPARRVPPALVIFCRSISDDDLCAWCGHLDYQPGDVSLCRRHSANHWPGSQDDNGYFEACPEYAAS